MLEIFMLNYLIKVVEVNICVLLKRLSDLWFYFRKIFAYLANTIRHREPYGTALNMFAYWPFQYIHKYKHACLSHIKDIYQ